MSRDHPAPDPRRALPSVDAGLQQMGDAIVRWGHEEVSQAIRGTLAQARQQLDQGHPVEVSTEALRQRVAAELHARHEPSLRPVFNLTGTVLHTNLGRALLPRESVAAMVAVATAPTTLEFDLASGERGERDSHVESLICELTGTEAATVVNNNAAAVFLVLNSLALGGEVPTSRGELVEIGGSFRVPEIMARSGCHLVEVGTTNRTHLEDYAAAIGERTALLMKVHTSNYRIEGFTHAVEEKALAALAREHGLPFVVDMGSGSLVDFATLGLPAEPTAAATVAQGADVITFSGDKLLGGPQCGIVAGRRELIERIRKNPLKRALRLDKLTLVALAEVLKLYRNPATLRERLPTLRLLTRPLANIEAQARRLLPAIAATLATHFQASVVPCNSQIGSGALPVDTLPSAAIEIIPVSGDDSELRALGEALRRLPVPVLGRTSRGRLLLDCRCLETEEDFLAQWAMLRESLA
ncbi:MAG: L-seryl-tRNA(Sec) selenium transferase [Gammaproteobacteria bacterium]|nr:L-seryl-tRNA(Sec) selenium transferase [Gammaproteobacteria bacterium]MBK9466404.1 L-seryl-tRNA(Sec) selenium transferase [Gammaproteobacteria bacterium]MBP7909029.1 L-seryl-tRNA(Sec) selenium transferase [Pseudomonadales bacterium]